MKFHWLDLCSELLVEQMKRPHSLLMITDVFLAKLSRVHNEAQYISAWEISDAATYHKRTVVDQLLHAVYCSSLVFSDGSPCLHDGDEPRLYRSSLLGTILQLYKQHCYRTQKINFENVRSLSCNWMECSFVHISQVCGYVCGYTFQIKYNILNNPSIHFPDLGFSQMTLMNPWMVCTKFDH